MDDTVRKPSDLIIDVAHVPVAPVAPMMPVANPHRRTLLQFGAGAALSGLVPPALKTVAWAAGSDAPEKKDVKIEDVTVATCLFAFDLLFGF